MSRFWAANSNGALGLGHSFCLRSGLPQSYFLPYGPATTAGTGGMPVVGTGVVSGDPSGHFQVVSNVLSITAAGKTAGLSGSPYTLLMNNGDTVTVTASSAGSIDVRTQAEWDAVDWTSTTALKGKTIYLRPDSYRAGGSIVTGVISGGTKLANADYLGLTVEGRTAAIDKSSFPPARTSDPCTIDKFYFRNTKNVTIRNLATTRVPETKVQLRGSTGDYVTGIWVDACHIGGIIADPQGDYSTSTNYPNYGNGTYYFIDTTGSNDNCVGGCKVTNCVLEWGNFGVNLCADRPGDTHMEVTGNLCQYLYVDCFHFSCGAGNQAHSLDFHDNLGMNPVGLGTDSANPHKDFCQYQSSATQTGDFTLRAYRNRMIAGTARGDTMQGFFIPSISSGLAFVIADIVGFLYVGGNQNAVQISSAKNCNIENVTCVSKAISPYAVDNISIILGDVSSSGTHTMSRCVADFYNIGAGATVTQTNNVTLGHQGATVPYSTAFAGPSFASPAATVAAAMAMFALKAGGPLDIAGTFKVGAVGAGRVNWATTIPGNDGSLIAATAKTTDTTLHTADNSSTTVDRA